MYNRQQNGSETGKVKVLAAIVQKNNFCYNGCEEYFSVFVMHLTVLQGQSFYDENDQ